MMSARTCLGRLAAAVLGWAVVAGARADDLNGYFQLTTLNSETSDEVLGFTPLESETRGILRRLSVNFYRQAFPLVSFSIGGTFDDIDQRLLSDGERFDGDELRLRPYASIERSTATWLAQLRWNRDYQRTGLEGGQRIALTRDTWLGSASWTPPEEGYDYWPVFRFSASRRNEHDGERAFRDSVIDAVDFDVNQNRLDNWRFGYRWSWSERTDHIFDTTTRTWSQGFNAVFEDSWRERVQFRAEYALNVRNTTLISSGDALDAPVFARVGLVSRTETVLVDTLGPAPGLIDGDRDTPTIIDLGLPPVGGDDRPWSFGLDFGDDRSIDTLFVWTDREIRPETAAAFTWSVYASVNNFDWRLVEVVEVAPYDTFLKRFRVDFSPVTTRFVKLVVHPLRPGDPFASEVSRLFVTELEAALRTTIPGNRADESSTFHGVNADVRARLLENRDLYFEGSYYFTDGSDEDFRYRLSSGLFYSQPIARTANWSSRVAWEEYNERYGNDRAFVYSTALSATPVERLRYTVSLSGREEQFADAIGGDQIGVYFYGNARLYQGVDVQVGVGRTFLEDSLGQTVEATQANASARIAPRNDLTIGLSYVDSLSERVGSSEPLASLFTRAAEANATYTPVPTVYLFGVYRLEWREAQPRDEIVRWIASWSPFPGGALRFGVNYEETRRSLLNRYERVFRPSLRWQINPRSYVEMSYVDIEDESDVRRFYNEAYSATLRWGF